MGQMVYSNKNAGGYCIVQEPSEAEAPAMPLAAIKKQTKQGIEVNRNC